MSKVKVFPRKGVLYVEYQEAGKRVRRTTKLKDNKTNLAYVYRNIIPEIENNLERGISTTNPATIGMFLDKILQEDRKYATQALYENAIKRFLNFFDRETYIADIRIKDIDSYIIMLSEEGVSGKSIRAYLSPVKQAFDEAIRQEYIEKNPVVWARKPKSQKQEKKALSLIQMQNMLQRCEDERLLTYLHLAFYTGARPNEILALRWEDITDKKISINKTLTRSGVNSPKSGKSREIYLLKPLADYLKTIKRGEPSENIVGLTYHTMINKFKKLIQSVGAKGTPHITRHTFISMLINAKKNPLLVQFMVGHSDLSMIENVYSHFIESEDDKKELEDALAI